MSIPSKTDLLALGCAFRGAPFVKAEAKPLNTNLLGTVFRGVPFVAAASSAPAPFPAHRMLALFC